jgi:hypothetical protein
MLREQTVGIWPHGLASSTSPARAWRQRHGQDVGGWVAQLAPVVAAPLSTEPEEVRASAWLSPAETAVMAVPAGRATLTGIGLAESMPVPSWPSRLSPHAKTAPEEVTARVNPKPAESAVTSASGGNETRLVSS